MPTGPPLILGFLKGVPFDWTLQHCWPQWLTTVGIVLLVFVVLDLINLRRSRKSIQEAELTSWRCDGAHNFIFLFVILAALIAVPAGWREPLVILTTLGSYLGTPERIRHANNFTFAPLGEIGWLFLGIFGTMDLHTSTSAILSAVIFNALIIIALIPLALRGVAYKPMGALAILQRNLLIYGFGGLIVPFIGIKLIDLIITALHLV